MATGSAGSVTLTCAVRRYFVPGTIPERVRPAPPAPVPTCIALLPAVPAPATTCALPQFDHADIPFSKPPSAIMLPEAGGGAALAGANTTSST